METAAASFPGIYFMGMCSRQERIQKDIDVVIQKSRAEKDCLFAGEFSLPRARTKPASSVRPPCVSGKRGVDCTSPFRGSLGNNRCGDDRSPRGRGRRPRPPRPQSVRPSGVPVGAHRGARPQPLAPAPAPAPGRGPAGERAAEAAPPAGNGAAALRCARLLRAAPGPSGGSAGQISAPRGPPSSPAGGVPPGERRDPEVPEAPAPQPGVALHPFRSPPKEGPDWAPAGSSPAGAASGCPTGKVPPLPWQLALVAGGGLGCTAGAQRAGAPRGAGLSGSAALASAWPGPPWARLTGGAVGVGVKNLLGGSL